jgi:hypothetical protein
MSIFVFIFVLMKYVMVILVEIVVIMRCILWDCYESCDLVFIVDLMTLVWIWMNCDLWIVEYGWDEMNIRWERMRKKKRKGKLKNNNGGNRGTTHDGADGAERIDGDGDISTRYWTQVLMSSSH